MIAQAQSVSFRWSPFSRSQYEHDTTVKFTKQIISCVYVVCVFCSSLFVVMLRTQQFLLSHFSPRWDVFWRKLLYDHFVVKKKKRSTFQEFTPSLITKQWSMTFFSPFLASTRLLLFWNMVICVWLTPDGVWLTETPNRRTQNNSHNRFATVDIINSRINCDSV